MVTGPGTVREHEGGRAGGFVQAFAFHFLVKCALWLQKPNDTQYLLSVSGNQKLDDDRALARGVCDGSRRVLCGMLPCPGPPPSGQAAPAWALGLSGG